MLVVGSLPVYAEGDAESHDYQDFVSSEGDSDSGGSEYSEDPTLYIRFFEPEVSYITTSSVITIKINGSDSMKRTFDVDSILEDEIVTIKVPKLGPKTISIHMDDSSEGFISHMLTQTETPYGYFMTVKANVEGTSVSEEAFELESVNKVELLGMSGSGLQIWDPNIVSTFDSIGTLDFNEDIDEYYVDMPLETNPTENGSSYFTVRDFKTTGGYINSVKSAQIIRINTYGSSGTINDVAEYNSSTGYVRYDVLVKYFDNDGDLQEKVIYLNAYHNYFTGLRVNTSQVVGEWTHGDMEANKFGDEYYIYKDVYVSTQYATVSLSNTSYNKFDSLDAASDDPRIIDQKDGSYKVLLDSPDTFLAFEFYATMKSTEEEVKIIVQISKKVVSMGRYVFPETGMEDAYVFYQPDDSFSVTNPKALVMMYYDVPHIGEHGPTRLRFLVETLVLDFYPPAQFGIGSDNSNELVAYIGAIDVTNKEYGVPTMSTVFLIEGDVSLDSETFGGVKYGIGDGWNGVFGNYEW